MPGLCDRVVRFQFLRLDLPTDTLRALAATLAPDEAARAARYSHDRERHRFIAARGQLRAALGRCLATDPARLEFTYSPQGKPALAGDFGRKALHFNLSHSRDLALLGVTRAGPIGVDVEQIRRLSDFDGLVSRFFSARERAGFAAVPEDQRPVVFFNLWTRKEAWLKATGEGLGGGLETVEVSFLPGEPARWLNLPGGTEAMARWSLQALPAPDGFAAAVAVESPDVQALPWS